jgi:hypothetical protein
LDDYFHNPTVRSLVLIIIERDRGSGFATDRKQASMNCRRLTMNANNRLMQLAVPGTDEEFQHAFLKTNLSIKQKSLPLLIDPYALGRIEWDCVHGDGQSFRTVWSIGTLHISIFSHAKKHNHKQRSAADDSIPVKS